MTMRQVSGLLKVINKSKLIEFYETVVSYRAWEGKEIPTLNEFLQSSLSKKPDEPIFDEETDRVLEAHALKRLQERQKENGK